MNSAEVLGLRNVALSAFTHSGEPKAPPATVCRQGARTVVVCESARHCRGTGSSLVSQSCVSIACARNRSTAYRNVPAHDLISAVIFKPSPIRLLSSSTFGLRGQSVQMA